MRIIITISVTIMVVAAIPQTSNSFRISWGDPNLAYATGGVMQHAKSVFDMTDEETIPLGVMMPNFDFNYSDYQMPLPTAEEKISINPDPSKALNGVAPLIDTQLLEIKVFDGSIYTAEEIKAAMIELKTTLPPDEKAELKISDTRVQEVMTTFCVCSHLKIGETLYQLHRYNDGTVAFVVRNGPRVCF